MSSISDSIMSHNKDIDILNDETSKTSNLEQEEFQNIKKKKVCKRRNRYEELLEDTFLSHIGEQRKKEYKFNNLNEEVRNILNKKRNISNNQKLNDNKKQNKKKDINNIKKTTINFHGDNYKKTFSPNNFMKYNFNFVQREQYKSKKAITNKERQHVNLPLPYSIFTKMNQLNNIPKKIWCPYLYKHDISLKEILNQIEKVWPKHVYKYKEDLALDIIKDKNYQINNICQFIKSNEFILFLQKLKKNIYKDEYIFY